MHNVAEGRLTFTTDVAGGVAGAEVILLAVGTPPGPDGSANLSFIFKAAEQVADALTGWAVLVTKSTVPVGTGDKIEAIVKKHAKHEFAVASNPEFLKEGDAVNDFMKPDRVVIGADDKRAIDALRALYAPFTRTSDRMLVMDRRSSELTKYAANSMLATRISFMNDLANLCELLGADIELVRKGMGSDGRIGPKFLFAGAGLRRQLLPQGPARRGQHRQGGRLRPRDPECGRRGQRAPEAEAGREGPGALRRQPEGQAHRGLGPGVQARHRRHRARRPRWCSSISCSPAGATVCATDPVAMEVVRKQLGDRIEYEESNYDVRQGRRRAGAGHRVARVPPPVVRAPEVADEAAGAVRRPQHLEPEPSTRRRLHVLRHRPRQGRRGRRVVSDERLRVPLPPREAGEGEASGIAEGSSRLSVAGGDRRRDRDRARAGRTAGPRAIAGAALGGSDVASISGGTYEADGRRRGCVVS